MSDPVQTPAPGEEWHVYVVEDQETYMARSADEAWETYVADVGQETAAERASRDQIHQLTDSELDQWQFNECDEDKAIAGKTFREALAIEVADLPKPRQFSTEYA